MKTSCDDLNVLMYGDDPMVCDSMNFVAYGKREREKGNLFFC